MKPKDYTEEKDRLLDISTRIDLKRLATIHDHINRGMGIVSRTRSELVRNSIDILYQLVVNNGNPRKFDSHKEAVFYLEEFGLAPDRKTRRGEKFEKQVIFSEEVDMSYLNIGSSNTVNDELYEHINMVHSVMKDQGLTPTQIETKLRSLCADKGYSYDEYVEKNKKPWENVTKSDKVIDPSTSNKDRLSRITQNETKMKEEEEEYWKNRIDDEDDGIDVE